MCQTLMVLVLPSIHSVSKEYRNCLVLVPKVDQDSGAGDFFRRNFMRNLGSRSGEQRKGVRKAVKSSTRIAAADRGIHCLLRP